MILCDFGGVFHAAIHVELAQSGSTVTNEEFLRHLIISQIRNIYQRNKNRYGELVICIDSHGASGWRKDIFPYYKAKRAEARSASVIQWKEIYISINKIIEELKEYFPFRVIKVPMLEADDIIAILAKYAPELTPVNILGNMESEVLIVSNDNDMRQLHKYRYVKQFAPQRNKLFKEENPEFYSIEHVLRGDPGDGVPNIRSNPDCFMTGERQKPVTAKFIRAFMESGKSALSEFERGRYEDNFKIINLDNVPEKYEAEVLEAYKSYVVPKNTMKLLAYCSNNGLNEIARKISDFI